MKISTRLSITHSVIASLIFILFGITIYLFASNYRKNAFQKRLKERVLITEKIFLEKDSFSPEELAKITDQFLHTLPQETEEVLEVRADQAAEFKYEYPPQVKDKLAQYDTFEFEDGLKQGVSRIFRVKGENYLIIVTAVDQAGLKNLNFLKNVIALLVLIGIPLIFTGSFFLTNKALLPISKKIDKANTISATNLHRRLNVHNPKDELGKMAIAFNKLLDRLEGSFEAQKAFIRNASHEIRNPLTAIMGEAEIATSKSRTEEEYIESLTTILSEAETLNSTVNNLLQLSKVTGNEENIQYEQIQFDEFLKEVKESYDFLNPENQLELTLADPSQRGNFPISGNKNLLKTGITNLFDNACKFSANERVLLLLSRDSEYVSLSIKDKGIGILDEDIEKVMTPFFRGNNAIRTKGSGIGLSLSSKIINLHLGMLEIESELDMGTEVRVKLPLAFT